LAITSVHTQEEQARRRRAERMGQQEAPAPERAERAPPVLSTASFPGLGPRRAAPDDSPYARGQRFATGGNRLKGRHDLVPGEATSLTVTWFVPPNGRLDPGDGTDVVEVGPLGDEVVHVYDDPPAGTVQYIVEARCFDPYDRLIGACKFSLPHHATGGIVIEGHSANTVPSP
jgi:hypothetical protein